MERVSLSEALRIFDELKEVYANAAELLPAGSIRRKRESVKDLDIVPIIKDRALFDAISFILFGERRGTYKGLLVEFYYPGPSPEFTQWLWTGDKRYRVSLHARAKAIGKRDYDETWKLNANGLFRNGELASSNVEEVAQLLHTPLLPPEEMTGSSKSLD